MQERYRKSIETRRKNGKSWHSEATKQKISKTEVGKFISEETRQKLKKAWTVDRKKNPNRKGCKHSLSTRKILSEITKNQWRNGVFNRKDYRSKGQIEVEEVLKKLKYKVISEYIINTRPYDIYIPNLNLIIEFNGTYWHLDERVYGKNFYDKSREITINAVHKNDDEKINLALSKGFKVKVIWQLDWEKITDKINFIRELLNDYQKG